MSEIEILIEKARDTLEAVEILLSHGKFDSAASRTYYAYFYIANALLLHLGSETSRHSQLISQYGLLYSKEKRLDPRFHRLLIEAFESQARR